MSDMTLGFFGPFQATLDDRPLTDFRTNKVRALLIYLAIAVVVAFPLSFICRCGAPLNKVYSVLVCRPCAQVILGRCSSAIYLL
jgi:hypothetical protein